MKTRNFNEIYEKMLIKKDPMLDKLQRRKQLLALVFLCLIILFFVIYPKMGNKNAFLVFYIILAFLDFGLLALIGIKYRQMYKINIIQNLVKSYSEGLNYNSKYGVSISDYVSSNFPGYFNKFHSEDLIQGNIDNEFNIKMSEIKLEKEETTIDGDGNTTTNSVIVFRGIYGFVDIRDKMPPYFYVSNDKKMNKYNDFRIEVDSAEFEKYYDLYSEDKIRTMQVFTAELIEEFNRAREELKATMELKSERGRIYFRIPMKDLFEAPDFSKTLDFNKMYNNFKVIDSPIRLISKLIENVNEVQ